MLTLPSAARLLSQTRDVPDLIALARSLGFTGEGAALDARARTALGLPTHVRSASVCEGRGVLRALCVIVPAGELARDAVTQLAQRIQRRSPFVLWLLLAIEREGDALAVAAAITAPTPQTSYLIAARNQVRDSDAETVRALAAAADGLDVLVHSRWCEILGREALTNRFFRALEGTVSRLAGSVAHTVPDDDARTLALLATTRLLFLAFLEAKGWLDGDHGFLRRTWDRAMTSGGNYHRRVLLPLCFGTLNTQRSRRAAAARAFGRVPFLNGGLFNRSAVERRYRHALFPDAALGTLVCDLLGGWRFTVREHAASHTEAAIDPEMLGRAFESLMASKDRRASGTFYTPRALVASAFDAALDSVIAPAPYAAQLTSLRAGDAGPCVATELHDRLANLRIIDPACGSGAFLVHALEELATLRARCGDRRDPGALRRDVLARQLFGIDRAPTAVWLCELRLWLAVVVETAGTDPHDVPPLPNLDAHIRVGDALAGDAFRAASAVPGARALARVRERYARATGVRKRTLARTLARAERTSALNSLDARLAALTAERRDIVAALRGRDLFGDRIRIDESTRVRIDMLRRHARELRAERHAVARGGAVGFDFAAQFADVGAHGGFDIVIGNPPWVRLHRIQSSERGRLRERFVVYRDAAWRGGALAAGAGPGFAAQVDLAALFVERSLNVAREGGTVALLVPAKLWRSLAGGGVRALLARATQLRVLEDWSEARATFDAAVYPSLLVATRTTPDRSAPVSVAEHHRDRVLRWSASQSDLAFDDSPGAPWLWLPAEPREGFDTVRSLGTPLAERESLRPRLGVKCGFNEAFIPASARDAQHVDAQLLRPLLRGDGVTRWRIEPQREQIIFPHDAYLRPLRELPRLTRRWMLRHRVRLAARSDCRGRTPWWSLFRVEAADSRAPRVVWADLTKSPRAAVIAPGDTTVPLNTCYVVRTRTPEEAHALAAWLNSPLAAAWLAALAEPARGGFRRLLGWTVALLPIPRDWERAIDVLAPLGARGVAGTPPASDELLDACLGAMGVARTAVESLLTWGHR